MRMKSISLGTSMGPARPCTQSAVREVAHPVSSPGGRESRLFFATSIALLTGAVTVSPPQALEARARIREAESKRASKGRESRGFEGDNTSRGAVRLSKSDCEQTGADERPELGRRADIGRGF